MWCDFDAFCREHGETGLTLRPARSGLHRGVPVPQPVLLPGRGRLRARATRSARPGTGSTRRSGRPRRPGSCRPHLAERDGALIYLSLGSLGSADVGLMQRLVDLLATTEHRVIVSKGPLADQITLHDNQVGEGVPAPAGDPAAGRPGHHPRRQQHRHRGVPPRQADDRAAAVLGPGRQRPAGRRDRVRPRLSTYGFRDEELTDAIDELLADRGARRPPCAMSARIKVDLRHGPRRRPHRARRHDRGSRHRLRFTATQEPCKTLPVLFGPRVTWRV